MKYLVGLKGTSNFIKLEANSELEAMSNYCKKNELNYTLVAPKLEVKKLEKGNKNDETSN